MTIAILPRILDYSTQDSYNFQSNRLEKYINQKSSQWIFGENLRSISMNIDLSSSFSDFRFTENIILENDEELTSQFSEHLLIYETISNLPKISRTISFKVIHEGKAKPNFSFDEEY